MKIRQPFSVPEIPSIGRILSVYRLNATEKEKEHVICLAGKHEKVIMYFAEVHVCDTE